MKYLLEEDDPAEETVSPKESAAEEVTEADARRKKRWDNLCLGVTLILVILYLIYSVQIGFVGFVSFFLNALGDFSFELITALLCMLFPLFCIAAVLFSTHFRKKERFILSLCVHLVPVGVVVLTLLL